MRLYTIIYNYFFIYADVIILLEVGRGKFYYIYFKNIVNGGNNMANANDIIVNEEGFWSREIRCPKCGSSNLNSLVSKSKSLYQYCEECNYEKDNSLKHVSIDSILMTIKNNFKKLEKNNTNLLSIDLVQEKSKLSLSVNRENLISENIPNELSNNDIFFIKNSIYYLIEDFYSYDNKVHNNISINII